MQKLHNTLKSNKNIQEIKFKGNKINAATKAFMNEELEKNKKI